MEKPRAFPYLVPVIDEKDSGRLSRRAFTTGLACFGAAIPAMAATPRVGTAEAPLPEEDPIDPKRLGGSVIAPVGDGVPPALMGRALAAMQTHNRLLWSRDVIAIADFTRPSAHPRFHIVDVLNGKTTTLLVSHGKGSDPAHSGMLQRFSGAVGSEATSRGAYLTSDPYVGQHGRSRRLIGLDPDNRTALERAIVIHSAWYVAPDVVAKQGMCGRSQGCFAVSPADLDFVLTRLGPGRLLYADRV